MPVDANKSMIQGSSGSYELVDEGLYNVEIVDVILKEGIETKFGLKNKYYFYMGILDEGKFRGRRIFYSTTDAFTSGFSGSRASNLYNLACAAVGEKIDTKKWFDVNSLIGKKIQVLVEHDATGKYADVKNILKSNSTGSLTADEKTKLLPKENTEIKKEEQDVFGADFPLDLDS